MNEMELMQFAHTVYNFLNSYHFYVFNQNELNYYSQELVKEIKSGKQGFVELEELKNAMDKSMNPVEKQNLYNLIVQFEQYIQGGVANESTQS